MAKILNFKSDLNDENQFFLMAESNKKHLTDWIKENLLPYKIKSINVHDCSMQLKRLYEKETGRYISNGEMKGAMIEAGFRTKDKDRTNWMFNISRKPTNEMYKRSR